MKRFPIEQPPKVYEYQISSFLGLDLQTDDIDINSNRSPNCSNVIRDYKGSVRKRYGYATKDSFYGKINGVHFLVVDKKKRVIHAGDKYYSDDKQVIYTGGDNLSVAQQINSKLYTLDGTAYTEYDGTTMKKPEGKIPVVIINRTPSGGGTPLEQINLLQPKRTEKFKGDGTSKDFQLTATGIDATPLTAKRLEADGTFKDLVEGTDFMVNRALGRVTFNTAPPVTPSAGEDNIFITFSKTVEGYADKINKCTMSVVYGMNGAHDRLIVTGNPNFKNYDWFSKSNDFTYFGDLDYNVVGQDNAAIMNYAIDNGLLITLKDNADNQVNSSVREFTLSDNKIILRSVGSIQAKGAISKYSFAYLETEPIYISTDNKATAITVADNRVERFSQSRSYYVDKHLSDLDLKNSFAVNYEGFYYFTAPDSIYALDGLQPAFEKNTPYSHRQYECYRFPDIKARIMWIDNGLWFGTEDGKIRKFEPGTYDDDGVPVVAVWETPLIFTDYWHAIKTFKHIYILLRSEIKTGVKVEAQIEGLWEEIIPYNTNWHYFSFENIDFSEFTFNTDKTARATGTKINIKKVDKIALRFTNDRNQPLSISKIGITYNVLRNVK